MAELLVAQEGEGLVLTLNRPDRRNALTLEMLDSLGQALDRAAEDRGVRAVILTGAGETAFSSGMDVAVIQAELARRPGAEQLRRVQRRLQAIVNRLEQLEKPTLAAIEGPCLGGGFELALACDLRIASSDARFGLPESRIGMIPDLGGTTRLARLVGPGTAKEWIFTGRQYPAVRALELGLINELVVPGDALVRTRAIVAELAGSGPRALTWAKRVIDRGLGLSLADSLELEQDAMAEIFPSDDFREGVTAFLEKRPPRFQG